MKRLLFVLASTVGICASAFAADTNTVTIHFTGRIIDQTCTLSDGTEGTTIDLGVYSTSYFTGQDTVTEKKPFSLKISGCTISEASSTENLPADHVRLTFRDTNNSTSEQSNGLLKNGKSSGGASNVGIIVQYKGSNNEYSNLFEDTSTGTQVRTLDKFARTTEDTETTLNFTAAMKPTNASLPTAGQVSGAMTVLLDTF